jgi:DNA invertase Pin-like site-specific DNA recombinase
MGDNMMNAVFYCRVSTEEESQANALINQIQEAKNCIINNEWNEVDSYIDEGKSGTQTKKRDEYNRLLNDMETSKFDLIVIKSQDRLNRNTKDWYLFIDKLVTNNKKLYFYLDNKYYTPDDALITGIKAILAEDYSRELSKKLNNAHRGRQANGTSVVITSNTWGYDKVNKKVVINEKEAEIVKLIYDLCIKGYGSRTISKELSNKGIKSRTGKDFAEITIRRIIRNPLFKGTAVMNKKHIDFNTKQTINNPEEEWIYHENAVPAIVSEEVWKQANKIMDTRSEEVHGKEFGTRRIGKNLGKSDLSSKIFCGECKSVYWRRYRKNRKGEQLVDWSCSEYIKRGRKNITDTRGKNLLKIKTKEGGCDNIHISEIDLNNILLNVSKDIFNKDKKIVDKLVGILKGIFLNDNSNEEKLQIEQDKNKIINQKNLLLDKLLDDIITNEDYKRKDSELEYKLNALIEKEKSINDRVKQYSDLEERISDISNYLQSEGTDDTNIKKLVEHISKIIIYQDYVEIYLDFYDTIVVNINKKTKKNKLENYQYVNTAKYLIPHTDKYRYDGKSKEVNVKICI